MSCHNIGLGMNSVVRKIITLMDSNQISTEAARTLILACMRGVNWCDGNYGEAIDYISEYLCGKCMRKVPKGETMYSISGFPFPKNCDSEGHVGKEFVCFEFCEECFDYVMQKYEVNPDVKNNPDCKCISRGEYKDDNNGCDW